MSPDRSAAYDGAKEVLGMGFGFGREGCECLWIIIIIVVVLCCCCNN